MSKAALDDDSHDYESNESKEVAAMAEEVNRAIREKDTPKLMRYFEDVLDNIHTSPSSSVWSQLEREAADDTHEREKIERQEAEFKVALIQQCNQSLASHGIRIYHVVESGERDGFEIFARDRVGRQYQARLPFALADEKIAVYGQEGFVRRMFDDVVRELLAAKDRYFARMQ